MIGYAISSILWALCGLVVGFFLGRSGQTTPTSNPPRGAELSTDSNTRGFLGSLRFDRIVGWVIIVMAVVSVITVSYTVSRQQDVVTCQADYNMAFVAALKERNEAAATDRQAQRELLTGMVTARDAATSRLLIDTYLRALDQADNRRDESPLPERPTC